MATDQPVPPQLPQDADPPRKRLEEFVRDLATSNGGWIVGTTVEVPEDS